VRKKVKKAAPRRSDYSRVTELVQDVGKSVATLAARVEALEHELRRRIQVENFSHELREGMPGVPAFEQ